MIITSVIGINYNAIFLSNKKLSVEKVAAYAGCKVKIESVFVCSNTLKDGYYFLPDGRIVKDYPYGYASCVSFSASETGESVINFNCSIVAQEI